MTVLLRNSANAAARKLLTKGDLIIAERMERIMQKKKVSEIWIMYNRATNMERVLFKTLILGLLLAVTIVLLSTHVFAETTIVASGDCGAEGSNITWELTSDGTLTVSGSGAMADYDAFFDDEAPWDSYRANIKSVILEGNITKIGSCAFSGLGNVNGTLSIPETVTEIGESAFSGASFIGDLVIPNSVVTLGGNAFASTLFDGTLTLSNQLTSIPEYAFNFNRFSGELVIPSSVEAIGRFAFSNSMNLRGNLTIPGTVKTVGSSAFGNFSGNANFGVLTIEAGVERIEASAFVRCMYYAVIFEGNSPTIGNDAFYANSLLFHREGATGYDGVFGYEFDGTVGEISTSTINLDLSLGSVEVFEANDYVCSVQHIGTSYQVMRSSSGSCLIRQSNNGTQTENTIKAVGGNPPITVTGLNIESADSAISVSPSTSLELTCLGTNTLHSTAKAGIYVPADAAIKINGSGSIDVQASSGYAGIGAWGGWSSNWCGIIQINGGIITATGGQSAGGSNGGAGIGGGCSGSVIINDGIVTSYGGGSSGAGIGAEGSATVEINGGTVLAKGAGAINSYGGGAGIGGINGRSGNITITGGSVEAIGGGSAAGIGGAAADDGGNTTITGGTVIATAGEGRLGERGAAIGGGARRNGGEYVYISNADVTLDGYYAIGGETGYDQITIEDSANVTVVSGGYVEKISISSDLLDTAALSNNNATVTIDAYGHSGLSYQWYQSEDGSTWTKLDTQTTSTLSIPMTSENDGYYYRCTLTNGWGNEVDSKTGQAFILAFTKQPTSVETGLNNTVSFEVEPSCANVTYQWQRSYNEGASWTNVQGEVYSTLVLNSTLSENDALYRCVITATNGDQLASESARITVSSSATTYTTKYFCEKPNGIGYDLVDQIVTEAAAGTTVNAPQKTYEYFTENTSLGITSGAVKADNSLALARYYDRHSYTISFNSNGGSDEAKITAKYGATINAPSNPTKMGHTFVGWYSDEELTQPYTFTTMPGGDMTVFAKWALVGAGRGIEYQITGIKLRDSSYNEITGIPRGKFYAEVSVKNLSSTTMDSLVLATYDSNGKMLDLNFLYANPQIGQTFTLGVSIDNSAGRVAKIKAFMLPVLNGLVPLAEAVEYS